MPTTPRATFLLLAFLLFSFLLGGCAGRDSLTGWPGRETVSTPEEIALLMDLYRDTAPDLDVEPEQDPSVLEAEELTANPETDEYEAPSESEESVLEEVTALEALGPWEAGAAPAEAGPARTCAEFPLTMNRHVQYYLDRFQNGQRESFSRWLARSSRYLPMIREKLAEAGLPAELAYLPIIESGFNPVASSKARAVGPWQFMKSTALHLGLKVNAYVDERRDPEKSTAAAIAYLSELYERFGSWHLAVAAYNAGPGTVERAITRQKTDNFWELAQGRHLRPETKRYVPKLIAAILIARAPESYGFDGIDFSSPLAYGTVAVPRRTSLAAAAVACNVEEKKLRLLNVELLKGLTPPDRSTYDLKVPVGTEAVLARNLERVRALAVVDFKSHVVTGGETVNKICRRYRISKTALLKANNLRSSRLIPGQRLRIPFQAVSYELLPEGGEEGQGYLAAEAAAKNLVLHTVQKGDTVYGLARRYRVPPDLIASWNDLKDIARIKEGQQLALYIKKAGSLQGGETGPRTILASIAGSGQLRHVREEETQPGKIGQKAEAVTSYLVQGGDTLWDIAHRYNVTPEMIKKLNHMDDDTIYPGLRLLIPTNQDADA